MDVRIDELRTSVDAIDGSALLTPATLERLVEAVLRALDSRERGERTRRAELDTRSIVEQQRRR